MVFSKKNKSVFSHTLIYTFGNFFSRGLSFILLPVYSHFISPSEFGIYSVIISILTIASTIFNFGLPGIFVKKLSELNSLDSKKKFFSNVISGITIVNLPIILFVMLFSEKLSLLIIGNENYALEIILGFISVYSLNYSYYFSVFFIASENSKKYVFINSTAAVLNFILNIFLVTILRLGINGIFISQIISSMLVIIMSKEIIKYYFSFELDFKYLIPIMIVSFPLLLSGIFSIIVELIDRLLVLKFLGEIQAGIYSFGYRLALIFNLFVLSFKTAWIPHYFNLKNQTDEEKSIHLGKVFTKLIFISSILILCIQMVIYFLFQIEIDSFRFFDKSYYETTGFIIYVMIGYFFSLLMGFYSIAPYKSNKTIHFLISDLIAVILNLALNFILIPKIGIKGAALSTMLAFGGGCVYLLYYSRKIIKVKYELGKIILIFFLISMAYLSFEVFKNIYSFISIICVLLVVGIKLGLIGENFKNLLKV